MVWNKFIPGIKLYTISYTIHGGEGEPRSTQKIWKGIATSTGVAMRCKSLKWFLTLYTQNASNQPPSPTTGLGNLWKCAGMEEAVNNRMSEETWGTEDSGSELLCPFLYPSAPLQNQSQKALSPKGGLREERRPIKPALQPLALTESCTLGPLPKILKLRPLK